MRYTIGVHIPERDGKIADGIYIIGRYGFSAILTEDSLTKNLSNYRIPIFDNLETAEKYVKDLAHSFRSDFHNRARSHRKKIEDYRLFLLKFDTPKMAHIVLKQDDWRAKPNTKYPGKRDYAFTIDISKKC